MNKPRLLKKYNSLFVACIASFMVMLIFPICVIAADVTIDADHFKDPVFRQYVSENFDTDKNDVLDAYEIDNAKRIILDNGKDAEMTCSSLSGIEYLPNLQVIYSFWHPINEINPRNNPELINITIGQGRLTTIDVSRNPKLQILDLTNNELSAVDVSNNPALTKLLLAQNNLRFLDVSKNLKLLVLQANLNDFNSLDLSANILLERVYIPGNWNLSSLKLGNHPNLKSLNVFNTNLTSLDLSGCRTINELSTGNSKIPVLQTIYLPIGTTPAKLEKDSITDIVYKDAQTGFCTVHTLKTATTKATLSNNGKKVTKCTVCGTVTKTETIYAAKKISLSAFTYTYDGKVKSPSVVVKDSKGKSLSSADYSITTPGGRKNVGKYTYKITLKGDYTGTKSLSMTINPAKTYIKTLTKGSKSFKVTWKKKSAQVTGYQIQYSLKSNFSSGNKTVTVKSYKTTSKTIKNLKDKKKYYVRIRTYKTVSGKKYYSAWSAVKAVTTK